VTLPTATGGADRTATFYYPDAPTCDMLALAPAEPTAAELEQMAAAYIQAIPASPLVFS